MKRHISKRRWFAFALLMTAAAALFLWRATKAECLAIVGNVVCRVDTNERVVALSFDDGPTPEGVDAVLPELQRRNVRATFFLIGNRMERWPGQAERLVAAGMELGNHSYSHRRMIGSSEAHYRAEILRTDRLLRAAGAQTTGLFRPPFGRRFIGLPRAATATGHHIIMWDVGDDVAHNPTAQAYADNIIGRVRPGSIILMHPMYRHNSVERAAQPLVLDGLHARGYRIITVGELLARR